MSCNGSVLIFTNPREQVAKRVSDELNKLGEKFFIVDVERFLLDDYLVSIKMGNHTESSLFFSVDGCAIGDEDIKSVWFRRPEGIISNHPDKTISTFKRQEAMATLWSAYTCLAEVYWLNHPIHALSHLEHNKARQLQLAKRVGLKVPDTLITNVPDELKEFADKHGGVVAVKMLRGRAFKKRGSEHYTGIYTNVVSASYLEKNIQAISATPVFAQEYIDKQVELRITVVGENIFCCAIHSQDSEKTKQDWRHYDMERVKHEEYQLPDAIKLSILEFMRVCKVDYGAIDMILTPDNEYVFLEINPSGQYIWIENLANPGISASIAKLLSNPPVCARKTWS